MNWTLLIAVIGLVIGFGSSTNLAAAYGIAVTGTMLITDFLAFAVARWLWHWSPWQALLGAAPFVFIDIAFFTANSIKIADGGWFPLIFGLSIYAMMTTWRRGRALLAERVRSDTLPLEPFIADISHTRVPRVPGTAVIMTQDASNVPFVLLHSIKHYKVLHKRIVFVTVTVLDIPHVDDSNRVVVEKLPDEFYRVKVFYGFMDAPDLPLALEWCAEAGLDLDLMDTTFFLGRETLITSFDSEMSYWRELLFVAMFRNSGSATAFFQIPSNRVVELGSQVVL